MIVVLCGGLSIVFLHGLFDVTMVGCLLIPRTQGMDD